MGKIESKIFFSKRAQGNFQNLLMEASNFIRKSSNQFHEINNIPII